VTIERKLISDHEVLVVSGRMDAENAPQFEKECNARIAEGRNTLVIDAGDLSYVSSMGLRCFVSVAKTLKVRGGELRICCLHGLVNQVFEITGLKRSLRIFESLESATGGVKE
jgi:anti-anti-sigma factor